MRLRCRVFLYVKENLLEILMLNEVNRDCKLKLIMLILRVEVIKVSFLCTQLLTWITKAIHFSFSFFLKIFFPKEKLKVSMLLLRYFSMSTMRKENEIKLIKKTRIEFVPIFLYFSFSFFIWRHYERPNIQKAQSI